MKRILSLLCILALLLSLSTAAFASSLTGENLTVDPETGFDAGSVTENGFYLNTTLNLAFPLEGWEVATDQQLAEMIGIAEDFVSGNWSELINENLENGQIAYLLMAYRECAALPSGAESLQLIVQNIGFSGVTLSEEQYLELALQGAADALGSSGITVNSGDITPLSIAGTDHASSLVSLTYGDANLYELMFCMQAQNYMTIATLTVANSDDAYAYAEQIALALDYKTKLNQDLYEGAWTTICGVLDLYLPSDWVEHTDYEDTDSGVYLVLTDPTEEKGLVGVFFSPEYLDGLGLSELSAEERADLDLLELLAEGEAHLHLYLNGIPAIAEMDTDSDALAIYFEQDGGIFGLLFTPLSDTDFMNTILNMMVSISPVGA